jgi:cold shock protein
LTVLDISAFAFSLGPWPGRLSKASPHDARHTVGRAGVLADESFVHRSAEIARQVRHPGDMTRGRVKFFKAEKGWGAISSDQVPADIWVHFSDIEMTGYRAFTAGDIVEFEYEECRQDSFRFRATRARYIASGPAPTLRRHGDRVDIVPDGTPDTPLSRRRAP